MEVQSVTRAFAILEYISEVSAAGVSEVARELSLNKSTAFGLIRTMVSAGYLQQVPECGKYEVSLKLYNLTNNMLRRLQIKDYARPLLERLSEKYGETVHLVIAFPREGIYIDKIESTKSIRIFTCIGDSLPLHATGVGKSILAFRSLADQREYIQGGKLQRYTDKTITDPDVLLEELAGIRKRGYSTDDGERLDDIYCVAVPILNNLKQPVYAVSISMPSYRASHELADQMVQDLLRTKEGIEILL